jgi:hypothetical protein
MRTCTVCRHAERGAIDEAIVSQVSMRDIAGRWRLSKSAVERHARAHVSTAAAAAQEARAEVSGDALVTRLRSMHDETSALLEEAKKTGDADVALRAIARLERQLELEARILSQLREVAPHTRVSVAVLPEWLGLRARILGALAGFPEACLAVATALSDGR